MQPLVSIIIPTHRPGHFKTALACALSQTYQNTEIIVSDNSGGTEIAAICAGHPTVIYRKNDNGRIPSNIAQPLALAKGDYIKYLFDDDLIYPHCIDTMMTMMHHCGVEQQAKVGLITSARHLIDDANVCFAELREPDVEGTKLVDGNGAIKRMLISQDNFIGEFSTILFRRSLIDCDNPESIFSVFGEEFPIGLVDVPLYLSILQKSNLLYIPFSLSAFRLHQAGGSNAAANPNIHHTISDWLRLARGGFEHGLMSPEEVRKAVGTFLQLTERHTERFGVQLAPSRQAALVFLEELDRLAEGPSATEALPQAGSLPDHAYAVEDARDAHSGDGRKSSESATTVRSNRGWLRKLWQSE